MSLRRGYVQVYTGQGKGKTTAALGLAIRASGAGLRICLVQFLKGRHCSEHVRLAALPGLTLLQFGTGIFIRKKPSARDRQQAAAGLAAVETALRSNRYDVVIADELCVAQALGLVAEKDVLDMIALRPAQVELVLTGRNASSKVMRAADLVTEMREKKHYFRQGVAGRLGIEA